MFVRIFWKLSLHLGERVEALDVETLSPWGARTGECALLVNGVPVLCFYIHVEEGTAATGC